MSNQSKTIFTPTALYVDGGVIGRNPSSIGITWAYTQVNEHGEGINDDSGFHLTSKTEPILGNNTAELLAMVNGLLSVPAGWSGIVYSDSANTIGRVSKGWKCNGVPEWLLVRLGAAMSHVNLAGCVFVQLDGHPTAAQLASGIGKRGNPVSIHNVHCDRLCTVEARKVLAARETARQIDAIEDGTTTENAGANATL